MVLVVGLCSGLAAGVMHPTACLADEEGQVVLRVTARTIDAFCETACPLNLSGKKRATINVLGKEVTQEVPWVATVTNARVTITPEKRTFVASVVAKTPSAPTLAWSDDVTGGLDVSYDTKRKAVVIRAVNVVAAIALGPLKMDVDVSKDIPEFAFQLEIPDIVVPSQGKTIGVDIDPKITFDTDTIVVKGTPTFRSRKGPARASSDRR